MKRIISTIAAITILFACLCITGSAAGEIFKITSPYAAVNWSTWNQYRANLHTHTTVSDGSVDFADMIEYHYKNNYDVLAITDHGVVDRGWTKPNVVRSLQFIQQITRDYAGLTGLTEERWQAISTGSDREGRPMLRVPYGIEHNLIGGHVNSWFADWGNGRVGGTFNYAVAVREVNRAGGLAVINHPGGPSDYKVWQIQRLMERYPALIGLEINAFRDNGTRNSRQLWDQLLENLAPTGRNVFGFAASDAHTLARVGCAWTWMLMPENTVGHLRESLETGAFFGVSRFMRNAAELAVISEKTGIELGNEWVADHDEPAPMVTKITAEQGVIALEAQDHAITLWISNGEVVATGDSIILGDSEGLGAYVRAEVWGPGGMLYTQPFLLEYAGMPGGNSVPWYFVDLVSWLPWNLIDSVFRGVIGFTSGIFLA